MGMTLNYYVISNYNHLLGGYKFGVAISLTAKN